MLLRMASASVLASSIRVSHSLRVSILAMSSFFDIVFTSFLDVGWLIVVVDAVVTYGQREQ